MQCAKNSLLFPACITTGRWTVTSEQLTYHQVEPTRGETGVAYVFSRDQDNDLLPLPDQEDPKAVDKMLAETFNQHASPTDNQYFWDSVNAKWLPYTRQQVLESVHIAAK